MLTGTTRCSPALLGAVAAVSLLVGGIGIMNIMLVSVTERTREIGIRLAIGALEREVLLQFLVEAVVLVVLRRHDRHPAGPVGLPRPRSLLRVPFVPDMGIVVIAFLFSAAVGVIFGYFPALKAARLDPIEPCGTSDTDSGDNCRVRQNRAAPSPGMWHTLERQGELSNAHPSAPSRGSRTPASAIPSTAARVRNSSYHCQGMRNAPAWVNGEPPRQQKKDPEMRSPGGLLTAGGGFEPPTSGL